MSVCVVVDEGFLQQLTRWKARVEEALANFLGNQTFLCDTLEEATSYGVLNGGKRLRPALVYATGCLFSNQKTGFSDNTPETAPLDAAACAVELMHSYSLIHDDLPAMDNADLRRGIPSCHKQFNPAMAILAGDGLQMLALQVLSNLHDRGGIAPAHILKLMDYLIRGVGSCWYGGGASFRDGAG